MYVFSLVTGIMLFIAAVIAAGWVMTKCLSAVFCCTCNDDDQDDDSLADED